VTEQIRNTQFFVAESTDNRYLGLIGITMIVGFVGPVAYIHCWHVTKEARKRTGIAIGRKLLEEAENWARAMGMPRITGAFIERGRDIDKVCNRVGYRVLGVNVCKEL